MDEPGFHPWWWMEDHIPYLLETERWVFHAGWCVRHPVTAFGDWRKMHFPPVAGDWVTDCRGETHRVVFVEGDDLVLDDGAKCSWFYCCERADHE